MSDGTTFAGRVKLFGAPHINGGEAGSYGNKCSMDFVLSWLFSPTHRNAIYDDDDEKGRYAAFCVGPHAKYETHGVLLMTEAKMNLYPDRELPSWASYRGDGVTKWPPANFDPDKYLKPDWRPMHILDEGDRLNKIIDQSMHGKGEGF